MKRLINLERLKQSLVNDFGITLKAVDAYLQKAIFNREVKSLNAREIKQLTTNADKELQGLFGAYTDGLKSNWRTLFSHRYKVHGDEAYKATRQRLNSPKSLMAYADKVFDKPLHLTTNVGISLDDLTKSFGKTESERIIRAIRLAHSEGLTNDKLVQLIRGSRANRYQDGILRTTTRNAHAIARTGTAIVASEAKQAFIRDNLDIIKGIRVNATLDSRTSPICRHLDHQFMPTHKAKYPPYHFNCRSSFEIVFDGYESPKNRASEFGVTENVSYYEWLKKQTPDYQDEVLGKARGKLFRDGGMSAEKFKSLQLDKNFTPLTLEQMRELEPLAFNQSKPSYQTINIGHLKPRASEVKRLQIEPAKLGEKPKQPRPAEAELADLLQQYFGIYLVRYDDRYHKQSPTGNPPDFAKKDDELPVKEWQTLDIMYAIGDDVDIKAYLHSITKSDKAWDRQKENIINHIEKSDIVPLDLRKFDKQRLEKIIGFVLSLDKKQQNKILIIKGDDDDYDK
ncbi:hypothetical protein [Moraxella bovis]|uniref:NAD+--asparagine ADP-ribosyltransferase n=1 Tax=Moraxella bovis TaxID=476 RepID=A0A378Q266_MORBO|nr:hypothetical protein [Moraxella bovis]STY93207.1 NAD+--asparagine ADP-ribosyltransferase [Moraxella bovis]